MPHLDLTVPVRQRLSSDARVLLSLLETLLNEVRRHVDLPPLTPEELDVHLAQALRPDQRRDRTWPS